VLTGQKPTSQEKHAKISGAIIAREPEMERFLTPSEITRYSEVSLPVLLKAVHSGELSASRSPDGAIQVRLEDAVTFCDSHDIDSSALVRLRKKRILVVDDDADFGELAIDVLSAEPTFLCRLAASIFEAKEIYLEFRPNLILVDSTLPDGSGSELLTEIWNLGIAPRPVVLGVTAISSKRDVSALMKMGAREVLVKPIPLGRLTEIVKEYLSETETRPCSDEENSKES